MNDVYELTIDRFERDRKTKIFQITERVATLFIDDPLQAEQSLPYMTFLPRQEFFWQLFYCGGSGDKSGDVGQTQRIRINRGFYKRE